MNPTDKLKCVNCRFWDRKGIQHSVTGMLAMCQNPQRQPPFFTSERECCNYFEENQPKNGTYHD